MFVCDDQTIGIFNDLATAPQSIADGVCSTTWTISGENSRTVE